MDIAIVTGSAGLIGSESVKFLAHKGFTVAGVDNDMRKYFFGEDASTRWNLQRLKEQAPSYRHTEADIRDAQAMEKLFAEYGKDIKLVIHTAAQPSHDWAAREPLTDFTVNANGTLVMLEMTRKFAPNAPFIFTSTNKVYGDTPNSLPLVERELRWEVDPAHHYAAHGIDEEMSIDHSKHSLFGASKVAADVLVQEYGKYFGMKTVCFRGGCLTGPAHSGTELHGFLAYLMKCAVNGKEYTIHGYKGKQVRDNIYSGDLVGMFWNFYQNPRPGEVYNTGGSRHSNCSMLEAIAMCEEITGKKMKCKYAEANRIGDHIWYVSDVRKFQRHFPQWRYTKGVREILVDIYNGLVSR